MPSSLIIVALAAAWLIVLVPMVARKRQEIVRTADSALAARVVRRGTSARIKRREEFAMSATPSEDEANIDHTSATVDLPEPEPSRTSDSDEALRRRRVDSDNSERSYRPGRGGFDPELAEIAARAKYAYRQRVVIALAVIAVVTAVAAVVVFPPLWWAHALVDVGLIGYLAYLRRQVRIENDIRQRRLARYHGAARSAERRPRELSENVEPSVSRVEETVEEKEETPAPPRARSASAIERETSAKTVRAMKNAVVLEAEDEAPDFYELNAAVPSFRRASGE